jgi:hypothetical protein
VIAVDSAGTRNRIELADNFAHLYRPDARACVMRLRASVSHLTDTRKLASINQTLAAAAH